MALRDSHDVTLPISTNVGTPRDSQDLVIAISKNVGTPRESQDVLLVFANRTQLEEEYWRNPVRPVPQVLSQRLPYSPLFGDQEELPAGFLLYGPLDEDFWQNPVRPVVQTHQWLHQYKFDSQEPLLSAPVVALDEDLWLNPVKPVALVLGWPQQFSFDVQSPFLVAPPVVVKPDKQSTRFYPNSKPFEFYTAPRTQAGRRGAKFTTLLTEKGAPRAFSMPMGSRNQPVVGKVFSFTMGGTIKIGASGGSLIVTPIYGATASGVNLGASISQPYGPNTTVVPWRLKGEIIFQLVDLTPGQCLVICTGSFSMKDVAVMFGSASPVQVDASSISPSASGALNFAVTFAPAVMNASAPTISTKYAFLR